MITLEPRSLTAERFAPYGDVIETSVDRVASMNASRFERFADLCKVETDPGGQVAIGIARCRIATVLPYRFEVVERHPLGSQAFIPLGQCRFFIVVGPPGQRIRAAALRAFVTNGWQGVNYHRGTWHMPLIALDEGQQFLIVDRAGEAENCDELTLDQPVTLVDQS